MNEVGGGAEAATCFDVQAYLFEERASPWVGAGDPALLSFLDGLRRERVAAYFVP
ncbi:hypothetical protein [Thermogemmatispora sp.]|uniref:hypothetical protein n=1 Tax=Thermogemmatispora sp. TaxID=1968838 RepID=UPI002ACC3947|nr:hypothetical protein [Thermogemmatispora sp.]